MVYIWTRHPFFVKFIIVRSVHSKSPYVFITLRKGSDFQQGVPDSLPTISMLSLIQNIINYLFLRDYEDVPREISSWQGVVKPWLLFQLLVYQTVNLTVYFI